MSGFVKGIADRTPDTDTTQVAVTMAFALGFGVLAVFISLWNNGTIWHGLLWAGAWSSVGWFLGFLFGIPRYLSTDTARTPVASGLELAKTDLASSIAAANDSREAAIQAGKAKTVADESAAKAAQTADQAAKDSTAAASRLAADPQNAALKDDAEAKAKAAELSKVESDKAAGIVEDAEAKFGAAEVAVGQAAAAEEAAKYKVAKESASATSSPRSSSLTVNTNLEQISDWLTKIIVGVSLVESQTLLAKMQSAATFMAKSMVKANDAAIRVVSSPDSTTAASLASAADSASAAASAASNAAVTATNGLNSFSSTESFAYAIMLYFLATGLLGSYLLTRLFLQKALDRAAHAGQQS